MLKGKITDQDLEKNLLDTQKDLYDGKLGTELLRVLKDNFPTADSAYILQWIPEQDEDIFWILIKPSIVSIIEVPRSSNHLMSKSTFRVMTTDDYLKRRLTPKTKRKVNLAVKLQVRQTID